MIQVPSPPPRRPGRRSTDGAVAHLSRRQTLTLFAFVVVSFLLLAYREEVLTDRIAAEQERACQVMQDVLIRFNVKQEALIAIDRTNFDISEAVREARIKVYQDAVLPLPRCEDLR